MNSNIRACTIELSFLGATCIPETSTFELEVTEVPFAPPAAAPHVLNVENLAIITTSKAD
jgi:hypothetical protein